MDFHKRLKNAMIPLFCTVFSAIAVHLVSQHLTDCSVTVYIVLWMFPVLYLILTVMGLFDFLDFGLSAVVCFVVIPVMALITYLIVGTFVFFGIGGIG